MAKHVVEFVETFEVRTPIGALVTIDTSTGEKREIAPAKEHVSVYQGGKTTEFTNKKDAEAFCKHHGSKVRYVGRD